jgi:CubicO group peptidase (beta-lactamase class C family)
VAGRLVDRGEIEWSTRTSDVFANFESFDPAFQSTTLAVFLAHRSGVQASTQFSANHWSSLFSQTGTHAEIRRWVSDTVLSDPPQLPPGDYLYANQGYAVAAAMMESATGLSWEELVTREIFAPLRMTSAHFGESFDDELPPRYPVGHDVTETSVPRAAHSQHYLKVAQAAWGPGGYVVCTLNDWAKFLHAQATAEMSDYLSAASAAALHQAFSGSEGYGLGVSAYDRSWATPGQALTHGGDIFGHRTVFWMAPEKDFFAIIFTNGRTSDNTTALALDDVASLLVGRYHASDGEGQILEVPSISESSDDDGEFSFRYATLPGVRYTLLKADGLSGWTPLAGHTSILSHTHEKTYTGDDAADASLFRIGVED